jgi:hypothetical protein
MIVEAVTWREVRGRVPRKRLPQTVYLRHKVPIEIREVARTAIVEAARVTMIDGSKKRFFSFDDRFFSDLDLAGLPLGDPRYYFACQPDNPAVLPDFSRRCFDLDGRSIEAHRLPEALDNSGVQFSRILTDDIDERTREIARRAASDYLIAEGKLWRRTPEPVWIVNRMTGRDPYQLHLRARGAAEGHFTFRLDRLDEARQYAAALSKIARRLFRDSVASVSMEPGLNLGDDRVPCIKSLARRVVDACPGGWLGLLADETVESWVTLRGALSAGERGASIDVDTMAGQCGLILKAIEDLSLNRFGEEDRRELSKALLPAVKRWREFEQGSFDLPMLDDLEAELVSEIAL